MEKINKVKLFIIVSITAIVLGVGLSVVKPLLGIDVNSTAGSVIGGMIVGGGMVLLLLALIKRTDDGKLKWLLKDK